MAVELKSRTKALFEKFFPERQIYHRSGGSVRYVSISPWRQAMIAGLATIVVGWCLFATASVLLRGPAPGLSGASADGKIAKLERDLQQANAQSAFAFSLLEERTSGFTKEIGEIQKRQDTLKKVLATLQGQDGADAVALKGNDRAVLVDSSIEEADPRQAKSGTQGGPSTEVAGFRAQTDQLRYQQTAFLDAAEDQAVERAERARGVLDQTGVSVSRATDQVDMGGPLIPLDKLGLATSANNGQADPFVQRAREVSARLQEARLMETLLRTVPLGAPVDVPYRETSGYGERRDPFTKRAAWHDGLDLAAFNRAPIIATAPGKVTWAGPKTGYGNAIEIDHGLGFKTRYGHLSAVSVKVGSEIAIGQKIGLMGSTGRSTGPHLHYEVFFRGKSFDPIKFLRAGKHVYEG
jgi:murein DD-endopeptidase MepM/ murein hydrolase activator NlpD